jgi:hypothetical protein
VGAADGVRAVIGDGVFSLAGLPDQFSYHVIQSESGTHGRFHQRVDEGGGVIIDFDAETTCLAVDPVNHRAWIGGTVLKNESTDPDYQTDIHAPGRDVWFRVLDAPESIDPTDRSTFLGFQGAAGIQTSAEYCAARLWAANNARTWPVTSGDIRIQSGGD